MIDSIKEKLWDWGIFDLAKEVYRLFVQKIGVKLLSFCMINKRLDKKSSKLVVGIMDPGGFGDTLMELPLIEKIIGAIGKEKCQIVFCNKYSSFYREFKQIDLALQYKNDIFSAAALAASCDLVLTVDPLASHIMMVQEYDKNKIGRCSAKLLKYCEENLKARKGLFRSGVHNYRVDQYGVMLGKHRIEFFDMQGVLGVTKNDPVRMPQYDQRVECLKKFSLEGKKYIAINRDAGCGDELYPKLWLREYYVKLMQMIREEYPNILLVLVGGKTDKELAPYADIDTTEKTSFSDLAVILKHSILLIAGEGGPVHLQHLLGGQSLVFFGATSSDLVGYDENINISSDTFLCKCYLMFDKWIEGCIFDKEQPKCMKSITPEYAMQKLRVFLEKRSI